MRMSVYVYMCVHVYMYVFVCRVIGTMSNVPDHYNLIYIHIYYIYAACVCDITTNKCYLKQCHAPQINNCVKKRTLNIVDLLGHLSVYQIII